MIQFKSKSFSITIDDWTLLTLRVGGQTLLPLSLLLWYVGYIPLSWCIIPAVVFASYYAIIILFVFLIAYHSAGNLPYVKQKCACGYTVSDRLGTQISKTCPRCGKELGQGDGGGTSIEGEK